jgi:hypothetical protein
MMKRKEKEEKYNKMGKPISIERFDWNQSLNVSYEESRDHLVSKLQLLLDS